MDQEYKKKVDKVNRKLNFFQSEDSEEEINNHNDEVKRARQRLLRKSANAALSDQFNNDSSSITVPDLTIRSIKSGEEEEEEEEDK